MWIPLRAARVRTSFQLDQHDRANFVARRMVQRQLQHAVFDLPGERLALMMLHDFDDCAAAATETAAVLRYMASIASREMRGDGIAAQFAVGREQPAFDGERLRLDVERANLAVVGQSALIGSRAFSAFSRCTSPVTSAVR